MQIILALLYFVVARPLPLERAHLTKQFSGAADPDLIDLEYREIRGRAGSCVMARAVCSTGSLYLVSSWRGVI